MEDCLAACDAYVPAPPGDSYDQPCIAVTFTGLYPTGKNCYLVRLFYSENYRLHANEL
jgi:hypothetical protein